MMSVRTVVLLSVKAGSKRSKGMTVWCVPTMAGPLTRREYCETYQLLTRQKHGPARSL